MDVVSRLEKTCVALPLAAAGVLATLVGPHGYVARPKLALAVFVFGLATSLLALVLVFRGGRPHWMRITASMEAAAFAGAAAWVMHLLSSVTLS